MTFDLSAWQLEQPVVLWALLALPLLALLRERSPAGHARWRSFGAMIGRGLGCTLLVVALARPFVETTQPDRSAVLVVDASASVDEGRRTQVERWVTDAYEAAGEAPVRAVVTGAGLSLVDDVDATTRQLERSGADDDGTDLRSALELGLASLPDARHQDVVLLTDGGVTRGRLADTLRVAGARDLPVHVVPLGPGALRASARAVTPQQDRLHGDPVEVAIQLEANAQVEGVVELRSNGSDALRASRTVTFGPGRGTTTLDYTPANAGLHDIDVRLVVDGDPQAADDVARARLRVKPRPQALVVGPGGQAAALRAAVAGYEPELAVRTAAELPAGPYSDYSVVVLLDPDLKRLAGARTSELVAYVKDGGQLLITGGERGLVTDEPGIEALVEILPVRFPKTKKKERAPLAVVYALDRSDSMAKGAKFELAAAALVQSLHLLPEGSRMGIIGFSDFPSWVVELAPVDDVDDVVRSLTQVKVRGGTSIYSSLQVAYEALRDDDALVKHVVLLSDGQSTTTFQRHGDIVTSMLRRRITVTTIAVSADSDRAEMERIAEAGGGRAHYAERFDELPQLFLDEMMMVTRTNKVEQEFEVHPVVGSRLLQRVPDDVTWPPLTGYVRGEQRPGSELALATADGHPVLVAGRYGRGTAALFTSDVGGEWSSRWREWEHHPALWEGVVEALLRPHPPPGLGLSTEVHGDVARIQFDALDTLKNPRGDLLVEALVEPATGEAYAVTMPPVGPGRYATDLPLSEGATLVRVAAVGTTSGRTGPPAPGGELLASVEPQPSEEVLAASFNPRLARAVADSTGGLFDPSADDVFGRPVPERAVREPRHAPLLWAAFILLLVDLGWRRLRVPGR